MNTQTIKKWLAQGNLKARDIKIVGKGAVYNLKYCKDMEKKSAH